MAAAAVAVVAIGWLVLGNSGKADPGTRGVPAAATADTPATVASTPVESLKVAASAPEVQPKITAPVEEPKPQPAEVTPAPVAKAPARTLPFISPAERRRLALLDRKKRDEANRLAQKPAQKPVVQAPVVPRPVTQSPVVSGSPSLSTSSVVTSPPARQTVAPPVQAELPPRPAVTAPAQPAEPRTESAASEVASVVAAYARAIESRDVTAVKRAYPGMTAEQARGFAQFFEATRSINVTFRVVGLETSGNSADARLVGTYEYVTTGSRTERQPVSFAASLRNDGSSWRLVSVR